ncbi:MAG TPA: DUF6249 domain-containing protein [Dinghuibacter sp.]|jgi:hypothetical protein|uniref:DUF6249 domain-containing protein n=1 Tax=Dinghuibacter sp. TaxID=2024697 RepID=UPI002CA6C757|nr:DUF6249 domain-containing protein [Dinghuibacter sp.]HTJ11915.1 DUF6249 domain-containing protein [Dinghuibacter sp.]
MQTENLVVFWLILSTLGAFTMIFGLRYTINRENMAMIEKGMDPRIKHARPRPAPFRNLKWGLLLVGAGLGLFLAYLLDNFVLFRVGHYEDVVRHEANGANVPIYFALIAIGGGLGLISSYRIEKKELLDKEK